MRSAGSTYQRDFQPKGDVEAQYRATAAVRSARRDGELRHVEFAWDLEEDKDAKSRAPAVPRLVFPPPPSTQAPSISAASAVSGDADGSTTPSADTSTKPVEKFAGAAKPARPTTASSSVVDSLLSKVWTGRVTSDPTVALAPASSTTAQLPVAPVFQRHREGSAGRPTPSNRKSLRAPSRAPAATYIADRPPFAMYGSADKAKFSARKRTHNVRATTGIYPHALTTGLTMGVVPPKSVASTPVPSGRAAGVAAVTLAKKVGDVAQDTGCCCGKTCACTCDCCVGRCPASSAVVSAPAPSAGPSDQLATNAIQPLGVADLVALVRRQVLAELQQQQPSLAHKTPADEGRDDRLLYDVGSEGQEHDEGDDEHEQEQDHSVALVGSSSSSAKSAARAALRAQLVHESAARAANWRTEYQSNYLGQAVAAGSRAAAGVEVLGAHRPHAATSTRLDEEWASRKQLLAMQAAGRW